jgi:ActR/RegA family two-component response regulator
LLKVGSSESLARILSSAATARVQIADVDLRFSATSGRSSIEKIVSPATDLQGTAVIA